MKILKSPDKEQLHNRVGNEATPVISLPFRSPPILGGGWSYLLLSGELLLALPAEAEQAALQDAVLPVPLLRLLS